MKAEILLVDDEALLAASISRRLRQTGYGCEIAPSLTAARDFLAEHSPQLIILDERLPDGSGLDFLGEIEAQGHLLCADVMMLTAYGEIGDAVEAMKRGAADYLTKPVDLNALTVAIDRTLTQQRLRLQLGIVGAAPGTVTPFADAERRLLEAALRETSGNISEAARRLGITRMAMRYRMAKHALGK